MPPRAVPKKRVALLRRRFRELVEWSFNGNLSLAARALQMPVSTVQKYYQEGPRRISKEVLKRIDDLTGLGEWIVNERSQEIWRSLEFDGIRHREGGPMYPVLRLVKWRVIRVIDEMEKQQHVTAQREALIDTAQREALVGVFFAPVLEGLKVGLFQGSRPGQHFNIAFIGDVDPKRPRSVAEWRRLTGMELERARQIHRLCEFWEGELRLAIKPRGRLDT